MFWLRAGRPSDRLVLTSRDSPQFRHQLTPHGYRFRGVSRVTVNWLIWRVHTVKQQVCSFECRIVAHYFICRKMRDNLTELFLNKLIVIGFGKWETLSLCKHTFSQTVFFCNKRLRRDEHETTNRHCSIHLYGTSLRGPVRTGFTGTVPFSWVLESPVSLSNKIQFGRTDVTGFFQVI
jgi:hypothetical protein